MKEGTHYPWKHNALLGLYSYSEFVQCGSDTEFAILCSHDSIHLTKFVGHLPCSGWDSEVNRTKYNVPDCCIIITFTSSNNKEKCVSQDFSGCKR